MFCSYCGSKIYLDDDTKRIEITKNIYYHKTYTDEAKIRDIESRERMKAKEYEERNKQWSREQQGKHNEFKQSLVIAFVVLVGCSLLLLGPSYYFKSEEQASIQQEAELHAIVEEVLQDIENRNFEAAHIKAETIYYTEGWSSDIEKKWNATRKELIKQIENAEKVAENQAKKENKNHATWWNPFD